MNIQLSTMSPAYMVSKQPRTENTQQNTSFSANNIQNTKQQNEKSNSILNTSEAQQQAQKQESKTQTNLSNHEMTKEVDFYGHEIERDLFGRKIERDAFGREIERDAFGREIERDAFGNEKQKTDALEEEKDVKEEKSSDKKEKDIFGNEKCETCSQRKYQDGSNDPSVSFKTPTAISPDRAAAAVRSHEMEHVFNEQARAKREGREVVSQFVTYSTGICPECHRIYISGGQTFTTTRPRQEELQVGIEKEIEKGKYFDAVA